MDAGRGMGVVDDAARDGGRMRRDRDPETWSGTLSDYLAETIAKCIRMSAYRKLVGRRGVWCDRAVEDMTQYVEISLEVSEYKALKLVEDKAWALADELHEAPDREREFVEDIEARFKPPSEP